MNMQNFFNSLSTTEKTELDNLIRNWNLETAETEAKKIILEAREKILIQKGERVKAIKLVKDRYNCTLLVAKVAVDNYLMTSVRH